MLVHWPFNTETAQTASAVCYQLVEVGAIRSRQASHLEPEALVSFKPMHHDGNLTFDAAIIVQPIPMQLAASLIPGSTWSADGKFLSEGTLAYSERRKLRIGKRTPPLRSLAQLLPLQTSRPAILQLASPDAWYVVLNNETENILIPCFELLRAFCYQDASGLSNYFFSRLSLDTLCWPIAEPTSANGFTAHFCIASTLRRKDEAKILAELLFNPYYCKFIQSAHAYLASAWHECKINKKILQAHIKASFNLGRDVLVEVHGTGFIYEDKKYFLVSRLIPSPRWHGFEKVIYHPLRNSPFTPLTNYPFPEAPQWAFRDMLHGRRSNPKIVLATGLPDSFRQFGPSRHNTPGVSTRNILPVVQSFAWARSIRAGLPPIFADDSILNHLWARPGYTPINEELILPKNQVFHQLCSSLKKLGCSTHPVRINNSAGRFGYRHSILPYACAPSPTTHLPDHRHRPLGVICVKWGGGSFYLFNLLGSDKAILHYRKNLIELSNEECNNFLLSAVNAHFDWASIGNKLPHSENSFVSIYYFYDDLDWSAENIFSELRHAISQYNKALAFDKQLIDSGYYNKGVLNRLDIASRSMSIIKKQHYAGEYIGEDFHLIS